MRRINRKPRKSMVCVTIFSILLTILSLPLFCQERITPEYRLNIRVNRLSPIIPGDPSTRPIRIYLDYHRCDSPSPEGVGMYFLNSRQSFSRSAFLSGESCRKFPADLLVSFDQEVIYDFLFTKIDNSIRTRLSENKGTKLLGLELGVVFEQDSLNVSKRFDEYNQVTKDLFDSNLLDFASNTNLKFRIIGLSSPEGDVEHNTQLAKERAKAGLVWLIDRFEKLTQQSIDVAIEDENNIVSLSGTDSDRFTIQYFSQASEYSNLILDNSGFNYNRSIRFILYED